MIENGRLVYIRKIMDAYISRNADCTDKELVDLFDELYDMKYSSLEVRYKRGIIQDAQNKRKSKIKK